MIQSQSKYPPVSKLARSEPSPFIPPMPLDHAAYIHPVQSYIWMHDLPLGMNEIFGVSMPDVQKVRLTEHLSIARFIEDHSGRSTGKTVNFLLALNVMASAVPNTASIWLGQDQSVGRAIVEEHLGGQIVVNRDFRRMISGTAANSTPRVLSKDGDSLCAYFNRSYFRSMSPSPQSDYKKMQSWRFNHGIFNEWTSWPRQEDIAETIEPIFTRTNMAYTKTRQLREVTERSMGISLGRLSNDDLRGRHERSDYIPREHMESTTPDVWPEVKDKFARNFERCFGFAYEYGVQDPDLGFTPIKTPDDIMAFFQYYEEGDEVYANKLIYDGSAKRPDDACYAHHEMMAEEVSMGNSQYAVYSIGVDDIPQEWDGIIFDSAKIEKARKKMLKEDFDRVYGGLWKQGRARNPFSWAEINRACKMDYFGQLKRESPGERFIAAVDSAQGTDKQYSTAEGVKDGRGDDAVLAIWEVGGNGIPHRLCQVEIARDVRSEPVAYDIHATDQCFEKFELILIDPGGHGKAVIERLAKKVVEKSGLDGIVDRIEVTPIVPYDRTDIEGARQIIIIFSLSNEFIAAAHIDSKSEKALMRSQDVLNSEMVTGFRNALINKEIILPSSLNMYKLSALRNAGEINEEQLLNMMNIRVGYKQLVRLRYVTDRDNKRMKTKSGVYTYTSKKGKKDVAWTIMMGHFLCESIARIECKLKSREESSGSKEHIPLIG